VRAQRRDANEPEIVEALELMGYIVDRCYAPTPYDLTARRVGSPLRLALEVKGTGGTLTASQQRELERHGIVVVRTADEAVQAAERYL
jgi:hypothetical protein